jgi:hypothetical protein
MCVYIYMCVCMCVCIYIYIYICLLHHRYLPLPAYMCTWEYTYTYIHTYIPKSVSSHGQKFLKQKHTDKKQTHTDKKLTHKKHTYKACIHMHIGNLAYLPHMHTHVQTKNLHTKNMHMNHVYTCTYAILQACIHSKHMHTHIHRNTDTLIYTYI